MGKAARKPGRVHEEPGREHGEPGRQHGRPVEGVAVRWIAERSRASQVGCPGKGGGRKRLIGFYIQPAEQ